MSHHVCYYCGSVGGNPDCSHCWAYVETQEERRKHEERKANGPTFASGCIRIVGFAVAITLIVSLFLSHPGWLHHSLFGEALDWVKHQLNRPAPKP
jgi:hypothetical protein